jgi:hypothetical protein
MLSSAQPRRTRPFQKRPNRINLCKRDGRAKCSKLVDDLKLAQRIDGQPLAPLVVQSKQHDRGLDRRRFVHRLDVAEMLHLLAADQVGGPLAIPSFFEIKESGGARKVSEKNRICFF